MNNLAAVNKPYFSWQTTKMPEGYRWTVTHNVGRTEPDQNGRYVDTKLVGTGMSATRAQAKGSAKRLVRLYNRR